MDHIGIEETHADEEVQMHTAQILRPQQLKSESLRAQFECSERKILAKGDSWFSTGSYPVCNMLQQMQFGQSTSILNLAIPGDTVDAMSERIETWQDDFSWQVGAKDARRWDAILLSGGGNDLIHALPGLIRATVSSDRATDYVDFDALRALEQRIRLSFARIVQFRDREGGANRDVPIFVHTYDYSSPSHAPARIYNLVAVNGPWLLPRMRDVPQAVQKSLSDYLLGRIAQTLLSLQATLPNFFVIDTRGTLRSVPPETTHRRGDWDNEIHPSRAGYRKLAPLVAGAVDAYLGRTFNRALLRNAPALASVFFA